MKCHRAHGAHHRGRLHVLSERMGPITLDDYFMLEDYDESKTVTLEPVGKHEVSRTSCSQHTGVRWCQPFVLTRHEKGLQPWREEGVDVIFPHRI